MLSLNFPSQLIDKIKSLLINLGELNKKLGQNFLIDANTLDKIIQISNHNVDTIIEIGPGIGNLTQSLLALSPVKNIILIEKDKRFIPILEEIANFYSNKNINIIQGDILENLVHISDKTTVIGNLPYNIGTEIIFNLLEKTHCASMTVMLQKEVVNRIKAQVNNKNYCWLSILTALLAEVRVYFDVESDMFYPQPKVTSTVIRLDRLSQPLFEVNIALLKSLTTKLFAQRRKTIGKVLSKLGTFKNINFNLRAENLTIEMLYQIVNQL
jgi:16S rRNA (adenine1518-N6/adenine1519-N6)-dimethyltransferase